MKKILLLAILISTCSNAQISHCNPFISIDNIDYKIVEASPIMGLDGLNCTPRWEVVAPSRFYYYRWAVFTDTRPIDPPQRPVEGEIMILRNLRNRNAIYTEAYINPNSNERVWEIERTLPSSWHNGDRVELRPIHKPQVATQIRYQHRPVVRWDRRTGRNGRSSFIIRYWYRPGFGGSLPNVDYFKVEVFDSQWPYDKFREEIVHASQYLRIPQGSTGLHHIVNACAPNQTSGCTRQSYIRITAINLGVEGNNERIIRSTIPGEREITN